MYNGIFFLIVFPLTMQGSSLITLSKEDFILFQSADFFPHFLCLAPGPL